MELEEECWFARLLPDGTPVVRFRGGEMMIDLDGLELISPPPELYREIFEERLARLGKPLRCVLRSTPIAGRVRGKLLCYGWHDKSGDVWLDLGGILLDAGVVRVAPGDFAEREEYLRRQRQAPPRRGGRRRKA